MYTEGIFFHAINGLRYFLKTEERNKVGFKETGFSGTDLLLVFPYKRTLARRA